MTRHMTLGTWALAAVIGVASHPLRAQNGSGKSGGGESQVRANGITIAYRSDGPASAQPILLINGVGGQLIDWPAELLTQLVKRGYRYLVYDNRDAGLSTKYDRPGGVVTTQVEEPAARTGWRDATRQAPR